MSRTYLSVKCDYFVIYIISPANIMSIKRIGNNENIYQTVLLCSFLRLKNSSIDIKTTQRYFIEYI